MSYAQLVNAVNNNFRSIDNQLSQTISISDNEDLRIMIGRLPDDSYGIVVSKEGTDVRDLYS